MPRTITDFDGNYRLEGVAPGHYVVMPIAPAFVVTDYSFRSIGKTIVIGSGEHVEGIDFALTRGGVITGKVADSNGRPVIEERVILIQADPAQPAILASPNWPRNAVTDDRGIYRIFGVPGGHYKVVVGQTGNGGLESPMRRAYQQTFYPDTTDQRKATIVEVTEGGEAANIDIVDWPCFADASARAAESSMAKPANQCLTGGGALARMSEPE